MSAKQPKMVFGLSLLYVGLGYLVFNIFILFVSYKNLIFYSSISTFDDALSQFSTLAVSVLGKGAPLGLLAICVGGITYPQSLSRITRIFVLGTSLFVLFVSLKCIMTIDGYYCGGGSLSKCYLEIAPSVLLVIFIGALANETAQLSADNDSR